MQSIRFNRTNWLTASAAPVRVFYGGGKSQQSSSQVSIPPEVLSQYSNVNSIANQVATTPFSQYSTDPNAFVAPLDATQQAGILGTNQASNEAQPFYQAASNQNQSSTTAAQSATAAAGAPVSASQIQNYENPYLSDVINPTSQLLNQQYATAQSGQLGNAISQGAFGGDRSAVAAANLQQQQGLAYGQTIGGLENQNYSQALGEANTQQQAGLQAAQQYGALGQAGATNEANIGSGAQAAGLAGAQAQLTAGQAQQQTEQAGETALYNQFLQQQSYPFQTTQFLANIAEGTGALSGTTTNSSQPAPFFSDERLKEDIQKVGKLHDGLDVIKYRYKGEKQTHLGLSAQDVEKKHPEAVGLAGGYKTVDYDAATKDAAGRKHRDAGGGFALDPSYLEAQQQAYAGAPWGNAGAGVGGAPYGGKSHVPPSTGGGHAQLAAAKAPTMSSQGGLGDMAKNLGQLEGLGKEGKSLWDDAKGSGLAGGLAGKLGLGTPPVGAPAPAQPAAAPPLANQPQAAGPAPAAPPSVPAPSMGRANAGQLASLDGGLAGAGSDADLADMFAARGGFLHRDAGGATYQDAADDDASAGGDVPYDSGTGMKGLTVPDDKPHNSLPTAAAPGAGSSGSGIGDALGDVGKIASTVLPFFLAKGGRVGLAGGGDPGTMPIPSTDYPEVYSQTANTDEGQVDVPALQAALRARAARENTAPPPAQPAGLNPTRDWPLPPPRPSDAPVARGDGLNPVDSNIYAPATPPARPPAASQNSSRAKIYAPATPPERSRDIPQGQKAGLNPDAPSPDAQPVQNQQQDMGGGQQQQTQPGQVLTQDNPGGIGDALNRNQGLLVPLLHGLGTMASSNSRYLGSAVLQGLGGAADSYEKTQDDMQQRLGNQPIIQQKQNDASNSDLNLYQSMINQRPEMANLTFAQFEQLKASGKLNSYTGPPGGGAPGGPGGYKYTVQEKNSLTLPNGVPASRDQGYLAGFAAHNAGIQSPFVQGQVHQANDQAGAIAGQGYTIDKNNNQVTPQGMNSRVMSQNQPVQQTAEANQYRNSANNYAENYGRTTSLLNEMDSIYRGYQAGPTSGWRSQAEKLIQDLDPNGTVLGHTSAGEDNDKIMKDIGQLTASQLGTMSAGAPKDAHELLNSFAATPDKSPGALRDLIIRGKAYTQQMNDYYSGFDPYKDSRSVFQYQKDFFGQNPYDKYRTQLEKTTPAYAGQTPQGGGGTTTAAAAPQGAPQGAKQAPDGNWYVPDTKRPGKYLRVD